MSVFYVDEIGHIKYLVRKVLKYLSLKYMAKILSCLMCVLVYIYIKWACNIPRNHVFVNGLFLTKKGIFFGRTVAYVTAVIN